MTEGSHFRLRARRRARRSAVRLRGRAPRPGFGGAGR